MISQSGDIKYTWCYLLMPLFNHIYVAFTSFPLGFADICTHGVAIFKH